MEKRREETRFDPKTDSSTILLTTARALNAKDSDKIRNLEEAITLRNR